MTNVMQYDAEKSKEYAKFAERNPAKQYLDYPEALRLLEEMGGARDMWDMKVLDIGCGNGAFTRMIAKHGMQVVGYDVSPQQIALARAKERISPLGIKYVVADQYSFQSESRFDAAVSNCVLMHARNTKDLTQFFRSASSHLTKDGFFVSVACNPDFQRFGQSVHDSVWHRKGRRVNFEFYADDEVIFSGHQRHFSRKQYENAALAGGFSDLEWVKLEVSRTGLEKYGRDFWDEYLKDPPHAVFVARKK